MWRDQCGHGAPQSTCSRHGGRAAPHAARLCTRLEEFAPWMQHKGPDVVRWDCPDEQAFRESDWSLGTSWTVSYVPLVLQLHNSRYSAFILVVLHFLWSTTCVKAAHLGISVGKSAKQREPVWRFIKKCIKLKQRGCFNANFFFSVWGSRKKCINIIGYLCSFLSISPKVILHFHAHTIDCFLFILRRFIFLFSGECFNLAEGPSPEWHKKPVLEILALIMLF